MLLSKPEIEKRLATGEIIVHPFKPENLGSAQYDVSLGEFIYREAVTEDRATIYNPYSEAHVRRSWQPDRAVLHCELVEDRGVVPLENIGPDEKIILVRPGEMILAHTEEFIGGVNETTTMMKARSSLGRNGIEVCRCAGMGDVGYANRWTMEINNTSRRNTTALVVGRRVAQLLFFHVGPINERDRYDKVGKYQTTASLEELKASWTPEAMLPKQWRDRECRAVQTPLEALIADVRRLMAEGKIPREMTREARINWVLGNLNASTNHRTIRELVEEAADRLDAERKS